jgi:antitoxin ParD1/3/4
MSLFLGLPPLIQITGFDSFLLFLYDRNHDELDGDATMNVSLTPELENFVQSEVDSGLYQTASEVVRAGLRRLKEDQEVRQPKPPGTLEELEARLMESIERLDRGGGVDGKDSLRRIRKRIKEARLHG